MTRKPFLSFVFFEGDIEGVSERRLAGAEAADDPNAALPGPAAIMHAAKKDRFWHSTPRELA